METETITDMETITAAITTDLTPGDQAVVAEERGTPRSSVHVSREHGFTLLEVLVAFIIASLALGVLYTAGVGGLQATQTASRYGEAVARARSHLTMATHASPLLPGDWRGDDGGGFAWHLRVAPIASTVVRPINALTARGSSNFPLTLYAIGVSIAWRDSDSVREVHLETEQLGQSIR